MLSSIEDTNKIASMIDSLNKKSSAPLRLWYVALKLSPPNAPPILDPRCCNRIEAISKMERIICAYGSIVRTVSMSERYYHIVL